MLRGRSKAEQFFKIDQCLRQIGCTEEHPAKHDNDHTVDPVKDLDRVFIQPFSKEQTFQNTEQGENQTPDNKGDVGAMPDTGHKKDHEKVETDSSQIDARSSKWNINIIPEPAS